MSSTVLAVGLVLCGPVWADTVELATGDKLEGVILEQTDETIVMDHPVLGRIEIPVSELKPPEPEKPGVFGTSFLRGFDKSLAAGFTGSSGKSKDANVNMDFKLGREITRYRMSFVSRYYFSSDDGNTSDNQLDAIYLHDFLIPDSKWFAFLSPHYRYDAEQDWNHRLGLRTGLGYQFYETDTWNVRGRLGGGVTRTITDDRADKSVGEDPERTEWTGLVGLNLGWTIMEGMSVDWNTLYEPDFSDMPNFRLESRAEWKVAIGYVEGLSFRLGGSYIYDGHESDRKRNDRKYYGSIVYDF